jgi:hypothetical protein
VDREDLLIKWLDGELNDAEITLFKQLILNRQLLIKKSSIPTLSLL